MHNMKMLKQYRENLSNSMNFGRIQKISPMSTIGRSWGHVKDNPEKWHLGKYQEPALLCVFKGCIGITVD